MKLKGLKVTRKVDGVYTVTPLYHAKRRGTMSAHSLASRGKVLVAVVTDVLARLIARGDLKR